jgi:hypothetical protein
MKQSPDKARVIKSILISRTKVYLGESFRVRVKTKKETQGNTVYVMINGAIGHDQYLQYSDYCGTRKITINAYNNEGVSEGRVIEIEVFNPPSSLRFPIIEIKKDFSQHYHIECDIKNAESLKLDNAFYEWQIDMDKHIAKTPAIKLSLEDRLDPESLYQTFNVKLTVQLPDETRLVARRSFTLWNDYAYSKLQRKIILPLTQYDFIAKRDKHYLIASVKVKNLENVPLFLTGRQIEFLYNDPEKISVPNKEENIKPITIKPCSTSEIDCSILLQHYPKDAWGYAMHYHGETEAGLKVAISVYFEFLTNHQIIKRVVHPELSKELNKLRINSLKHTPNTFTMEEVGHILKKQNFRTEKISALKSEYAEGEWVSASKIGINEDAQTNIIDTLQQGFMYETKNEGDECLPDQEVPSEDMVCQLTDEWAWVFVPARIMNARKGDTILSPSGTSGPISLVLHNVDPLQNFAHSGIMVQNFYAIRHSTASDDWLQDEDFFAGTAITGDKGTEGLDPDRLKYIWPGPVTQTVDESFNGRWCDDPEGHKKKDGTLKTWRIAAFDFYAKDNGNNLIVEPLVVKPDALIEAAIPAVRNLLHQVAEEAKKIKGHYRFYCYTDASISLGDEYNAPEREGWWASGSKPIMCSNFIWLAAKSVINPLIHLEGPKEITLPADLEATDVEAKVDDQTIDGLYFYDSTERKKAGEALYKMYYDIAMEKTFWRFGNDAPDDIASQICNTFASDWSGENAEGDHAKDSDNWQETVNGRTVSPADILLWDAPKLEDKTIMGLYGHAEKLIYRPGRLEWRQVSRWKKVNLNGQLTGQVIRRGVPQAGAFVTAGGQEILTNGEGRFSLTVKAGRYSVESRIFADNFEWEGNTPIDVPAGGNAEVTIFLNEPPDWFREVSISGTMTIKDEETFEDEFATRSKLFKVYRIGAFSTHEQDGWKEKMGGEIRVELSISLDWQMIDSSVNVTCNLKLFEGTTENTDDLDGEKTQTFNIQKNVIDQTCQMFVSNTDENDDDHVDLVLKISNRRQP